MIDFSDKTFRALLQAMLEQVPDTFDKRDASPIPTALSPAAWALEGFYMVLNQVQQQAFIQTATGENLDLLGVIAGLTRNPATPAVRLGVFDIAVGLGARFSTIAGENSIDFSVTAATDTPGEYRLTAETAGSIGNDYSGAILPITTIPGLTSALLTDILVPGEDEETDEDFRARILAALVNKPFGGNIESYREYVLAMDGVGAVQVWPTWDGGGTVKLSVLGADFLPASQILIDEVQAAIDPAPNQGLGLGLAPIGATVTVVSPSSAVCPISATLTLASGYTLQQVKPVVEAALESYFDEVRRVWGNQQSPSAVSYSADIYLSRVTAAIINVQGITNVTDVTLNGSAADFTTTQTGAAQQVPVLGTVTLS